MVRNLRSIIDDLLLDAMSKSRKSPNQLAADINAVGEADGSTVKIRPQAVNSAVRRGRSEVPRTVDYLIDALGFEVALIPKRPGARRAWIMDELKKLDENKQKRLSEIS